MEAVGFKLMHRQAGAYLEVVEYILRFQVSVVHLIRSNFLDVILSKEATVQRGAFSVRTGEQVEPVQIRLSTKNLLERLTQQEQEVRKGRKRFATSTIPYMEVEYERLVAAKTEFSSLLNVNDRETLATSMQRLNTARHRDLIENYDCVKETLAGTRFAMLLREAP